MTQKKIRLVVYFLLALGMVSLVYGQNLGPGIASAFSPLEDLLEAYFNSPHNPGQADVALVVDTLIMMIVFYFVSFVSLRPRFEEYAQRMAYPISIALGLGYAGLEYFSGFRIWESPFMYLVLAGFVYSYFAAGDQEFQRRMRPILIGIGLIALGQGIILLNGLTINGNQVINLGPTVSGIGELLRLGGFLVALVGTFTLVFRSFGDGEGGGVFGGLQGAGESAMDLGRSAWNGGRRLLGRGDDDDQEDPAVEALEAEIATIQPDLLNFRTQVRTFRNSVAPAIMGAPLPIRARLRNNFTSAAREVVNSERSLRNSLAQIRANPAYAELSTAAQNDYNAALTTVAAQYALFMASYAPALVRL